MSHAVPEQGHTKISLGCIFFLLIPAPESPSNSAALQLHFWEHGLNG